MTDDSLPRTIGGFDILSRIALGGMAEIYLAQSRGYGGFQKRVVVKRLHDEYEGDPAFVAMLVDEARITAQLQHANVVQVIDLGIDHGRVFMALELVDGRDLFQVLKELHARDLFMPIEAACFIVAEVCAGLHFAHTRHDQTTGEPLNIVHRDVSPQNVLLSWQGEVKLGDFGIVKATQRVTQTQAGVIKGKFYYMSPEQSCGAPLDHRSDIFSAGIVLYEALTASPLYDDEDDVVLMDRVRTGRVESPRRKRPEIPPELEAICLRALAADPARRYGTALELSRALSGYLASRGSAFGKAELSEFLTALFEAPSGGAPAAELRSVDTDPELVPAGERPDVAETLDSPAMAKPVPLPPVGLADAAADTVDGASLAQAEEERTRSVRSQPPRAEPPRRVPEAVVLAPPPEARRAEAGDPHENELTARLSRAEIVALNQQIMENMKRRSAGGEAEGAEPVAAEPAVAFPPAFPPAFPHTIDRRMRLALFALVAAVVLLTATILWLVMHPVTLEAPPPGATRVSEPRNPTLDVEAPPSPPIAPTPAFVEPSASPALLVVRPARADQRYRLYVDGELVVPKGNRVPLSPGRHSVSARVGDVRVPELEVDAVPGQPISFALPD